MGQGSIFLTISPFLVIDDNTTKASKYFFLKFENYLLAGMQCKGQDYMMLKDTTCKTKGYHIKTYLALANVPMWHYGFKSLPNSIINNPPLLGPLPLINYYHYYL